MELNIRKLVVGALALAIVIAVYVLYGRFSDTADVDIGKALQSVDPLAESNVGSFDGEVGKIGEVGVDEIRNARFERLNENKEIDRVFGFKELLHVIGDEWEIEKPFIDIYRPGLECSITSDSGRVQVITVVGRPAPKDATLTGNVVIHILPRGRSSVEESTIYLDDVTFLSGKSQFSTAGPVRFVSKQVQLIGTGMEFVYNEQENRLELLKIADLKSLRLRIQSDSPLLSSPEHPDETGADPSDPPNARAPSRPPKTHGKAQNTQKTDSPPPQQAVAEYYKVIFSENVIVETPEHLVFADQLSINNMLWKEASNDRSEPAPRAADTPTATPDAARTNPDTAPGAKKPASEGNAAAESDKQFVDIIVTCDGGILAAPMSFPQPPFTADKKTTVTGGKGLKNYGDTGGRASAVARKISYCARAEEVTLEGNCSCEMPKQHVGFQRKYILSGPRIWVKLAKDKEKQTSGPANNIEHLTADGGMVHLATVKTRGEEQLGFTKLECANFDFDPPGQVALAAGPNCRILVDNSEVSPADANGGKFGLRKQCYAQVEKFDTLKYLLDSNRILLDSKSEKIQLDYIPVRTGKQGKVIHSYAANVEATIFETADGRSELSTLKATGGVKYEEKAEQPPQGQAGDMIFVGTEFFFDAVKGILTAWGDESQDCLLNGAIVDGIKYDLNTGEVHSQLVAPGTIRMQ